MGLDAVVEVARGILRFSVNTGSLSRVLALVGIGIILVLALGYGLYGAVKLGKAILQMKVNHFTAMLAAIGVALIVIAALLP